MQGFVESLPFKDQSVDRVYTRQAIHHFGDLAQGIKECARILKPGGLFFGTREHVVTDANELKIFLRDHIMQSLHGHENAFTLEQYTSAIEGAGLQIVSVMGRFDNVINYYPGTEVERIDELAKWAKSRGGNLAGWLVKHLPPLQWQVANKLSRYDRYPGRLHGFLAIKR